MLVVESQGDVVQQGIEGYEQMVSIVAFWAKAYWAMWGPLGQPMIEGVDRWAERQRECLKGVRGSSIPRSVSPAKLPIPFLPP